MSVTLEVLEGLLALEVTLDQWDVPPTLGILQSTSGVIYVDPIGFSPTFWDMGEMPDILTVLAKALALPGHPPFPYQMPEGARFEGIAFFCEGWALDSKGMTEDERREAMEFAAEFGVHAHPARIECKMVSAVDHAGRRYAVQHERGAEAARARVADGDMEVGGRLFDALGDLMVQVRREVLS